MSLLIKLNSIVFNHRVSENIAGHSLNVFAGFFSRERVVNGDLEVLALPNIFNSSIADRFNCVMNGLALRV